MTSRLWTPADLDGVILWVVGDSPENTVVDGIVWLLANRSGGPPMLPASTASDASCAEVGQLGSRACLSTSAAHAAKFYALGTAQALAGASGTTLIVLQRQRRALPENKTIACIQTSDSLARVIFRRMRGNLNASGFRAGPADAAASAALSAQGTDWIIASVRADWAAGRGRVQAGGAYVEAAISEGVVEQAASSQDFQLGAQGAATGNSDQEIAELLWFNRALTDAEHAQVEGYLAHAWGVQDSLIDGHPYKAAAPAIPDESQESDEPIAPQPTVASEDPFGADAGTLYMAMRDDGEWDLVAHASGVGLALDPTLATLVACSLFCDSAVDLDEAARAGKDDRGGYWADAYSATRDRWGSRLWLLDRAKPTRATAQAHEAAAREALEWMIADGIAESIEASATIVSGLGDATLELTIRIRRPRNLVAKFQEIWEATYAL